MTAGEEKNSPSRSEPLQGLESPFLDRELFTGQGAEEWQACLGVLEEEGAFLRAFEQPWAQPPSYQKAEPVPRSEAEDYELEQGITGEDDRVEVADTTVAPYRWICSVTYEKGGATLDGGSGVLISDRHVLTAGHVIKEAGSGPDAPSLVIYPGRHYGGEPFGRYLASRTRLPNFNMDFGLITLTRPVEPALLWWGHPSTNTDWWSEAAIPLRQLRQTALPITTAGFPGAKDAYRRRMYEARGETVPARFGGVFRHTADTTRGQSGSPIWTERQGRRILIGLATAFDELPNQIAVFAHDNLMQRVLRQWMAQDAPRPPRVERRIALEIPYRWACRLEVYDNDLRRTVGYGSGLLISNQHVLTSARVIHGFVQDRRRYAVSVAPGYEFGKEAFGSTTAAKGRTSPRFSPDSKDASAEFGLLTLSRALGTASFAAIKNAALGSWGGANYGIVSSAADWSGKPAHIAAFSRSAGGGGAYQKLRVSSGAFVGLTSEQILHRASLKLDAPGAPLWVEAGDRRLLVGIATTVFSKDSEVNWGCYLSEEAQSHLRQWMNEDFESHETEAGDRFSQDETEIFAAEAGAEPGPQGVKAADESDDLSDMERGSDQEVEDGMAGHAPAELAMEWAADEDESPLTWAGAVEAEEDARLEYDTPPMTQAISDAADQKDWPRLLNLAMQVGWHDENQLTNLLFYSRHLELDRRKLEPKKNKEDRKLAQEWSQILYKEVRPAIYKASDNTSLKVEGKFVAERDRLFSGEMGKKFKELVEWAAKEAEINPGLLAAVLLAEWDRRSLYLQSGEAHSFVTGTDDFFAQRDKIRESVPAFSKVRFDETRKATVPNEHGRMVTSIPFSSGKDAALATAVYLKYAENKLRKAAQKNGGDFDALPIETRFALVRIAMAAGHGGFTPDGDIVRYRWTKDKDNKYIPVPLKKGEKGGVPIGVALRLEQVLQGKDILVRKYEPPGDPTNSMHVTNRNATIRAAQAMHLGDWFFRAHPLGIQPELEESGLYQSNASENEWQEVSPRAAHEQYADELEQTEESDEFAEPFFESDEYYPEPLMEELVPKVSASDLRKRIDEYFDFAKAEYTLSDGSKVKARSQFHIASVGSPEQDAEKIEKLFEKKFGVAFSRPLHTPIRCAAYGRARPDEIQVITQHLIDAGEMDAVRADNPGFSDEQLVRALQFQFNIGMDCAGYVQLAFIYAFTGKHDDARCNLASFKFREDLGLKAKRSDENLAALPAKHFKEVGFLNGQTGDLLVLAWRKGERDWHTVIVVDHTVSDDVHTFVVDASWGFLYGADAAGVARRQLVHDTSSGKWWDIHPIDGTKVNENSIGPYRGHPIKGMYRARQK